MLTVYIIATILFFVISLFVEQEWQKFNLWAIGLTFGGCAFFLWIMNSL